MIRKNYLFLILIVLATILFFVLTPNKYISAGDIEAVEMAPNTWITKLFYFWMPSQGFGTTMSPQGLQVLFYFFQEKLSQIFGIIYGQRIFYYLLWILPIPFVYIILKKITSNDELSSVLSIIYLFSYPLQIANSYLLPFIFINNFLIVFTLYYFIKNKKGIIHWELILIYFLTTLISRNQANFLIFYIYLILLFFFRYLLNKKEESFYYFLKKVFINMIIAILINLIWIIPGLYEIVGNQNNYLSDNWNNKVLAGANYLWIDTGLKGFFRMFSHDFFVSWSERPTYDYSSFYNNPIWIFLAFVPIFLVSLLLLKKRKEKLENWIIYGIVSLLILLFLLKGASEPFGSIYLYALDKIPLFVAFRNTTTKFLIFAFFLTFMLLAAFLKEVKNKKILIFFVILLISLYNLPIIYEQNLLNNRHYFDLNNNKDYLDICNEINSQNEYQRILLLPLYQSTQITRNDLWVGYDLIVQCYQKGTWTLGSSFNQPLNKEFYDKITDEIYNQTEISTINFYEYRITHIIWHKDANPNYMTGGAYLNELILKKIDQDPRFIKYKETNNFIIYKIKTDNDIYPKIISEDIEFKQVNPTKYHIYIKNLKNSQDISFLESYHPDWKFYLVKNPISYNCNKLEYYENTQTTECESTQKFFEGEELKYLYEKPVFDNTHNMTYNYANRWTIDPNYINDNYSPEYYKQNADGSIDVELVMYFKPQSYFYLGLLISSITLILCITYLIWNWRKTTKSNL
jgi:hypothetical protein